MTKFIHLTNGHFETILNTNFYNIPSPQILTKDNKHHKLEHIKKDDYFFEIEFKKDHFVHFYIKKEDYNMFLDRKPININDQNKCIILKMIKYGIKIYELILSNDIEHSKKIYLRDVQNSDIVDLTFELSGNLFQIFSTQYYYDAKFNDIEYYFKLTEIFNIQKELINLGKLLIIKKITEKPHYKFVIFDLNVIKKIIFNNNFIEIFDSSDNIIFANDDI